MDFKNPGLVSFSNSFKTLKPKGIIICGLPRSGTTAVAKCLQNAGFQLGTNLSNVLEDHGFSQCMNNFTPSAVDTYIYNRSLIQCSFPWVAKYPDAYKHLHHLARLDEIAVIIVTRDPLAIAKRNNISVFQDVKFLLSKASAEYQELVDLVLSAECLDRVAMLSYEKLLSSTNSTLVQVFDWLGFSHQDSSHLSLKASGAIELNSSGYLAESNLIPTYAIDSFSREKMAGWCFFAAAPARRVLLVLEQKGSPVLEIECSKYRQDLVGLTPTGECSFDFKVDSLPEEFPEGFALRIKHTHHYLKIPSK